MKYLLRIDELYKSTYRRASDKLRGKHKKRSDEIIKWAEERGESELKKPDVEREYPYPFLFNNKSLEDAKHNFLGKFYITNYKSGPYGSNPHARILEIDMIGDWGQKVSIKLTIFYPSYAILRMSISYGDKYERDFLFDNRKDAIQFRKYLIEQDKEAAKLKINSIYTSNED